jgi:hypothetical protein
VGANKGREFSMALATAARQDIVKVHTLLQDKPRNTPLKRSELQSSVVEFDFDNIKEASDHFKPMVRDLVYDCGELAIVTYLQAKAYNKALVLLPFVVSGNFHHKSIAYNAAKGDLAPAGLAGRRVEVADLLANHRRVGARHSTARVRGRPRQGDVGNLRRLPSRRI